VVDDYGGQLCNIRSSADARTNIAAAMVTAERRRHARVANADIVDRLDMPKIPGLVAYLQGESGKPPD
jgi:hypothetical protein